MTNTDIRLLIVDDSKIMRDAIADMFTYGTNINVVATAANGAEAIDAINEHKPDVVTMDVSMPVMDGMSALKHIMIENPIPTVMLSSLTLEGARVAFDALRFGAIDFISKPSSVQDTDLSDQEAEIRGKIEYAAEVEVNAIKYIRETNAVHPVADDLNTQQPERIISIGAAEGGYGALLKIIPYLQSDLPYSYLVTLYAAREHVDAFASYLNHYSSVHVKRAAHDDVLKPGVCYINSGMDYMTVHAQDDNYNLHVSQAPFATRKGAIDMLMFSTVEVMGDKCVGVILSGMGRDGSEGLEEILHRGGDGVLQDPVTCLCKNMVNSAMSVNELSNVIADNKIAGFINAINK